jgi:hypothetical protein
LKIPKCINIKDWEKIGYSEIGKWMKNYNTFKFFFYNIYPIIII